MLNKYNIDSATWIAQKLNDGVQYSAGIHPKVMRDDHRYGYPVCLDDAGWCDHYGHRRGDVDVERL